jgi:hypothetical protein
MDVVALNVPQLPIVDEGRSGSQGRVDPLAAEGGNEPAQGEEEGERSPGVPEVVATCVLQSPFMSYRQELWIGVIKRPP